MYKICKIIEIACAHKLNGHDGKCANVHGHNYKVEVTIKGVELNDMNMLMDFKLLKEIMQEKIDEPYDHKYLNSELPFNTSNPTAEYMAGVFYHMLRISVANMSKHKASIYKVRVWETSTSWAEYTEE